MTTRRLLLAAFAIAALAQFSCPAALADGDCTVRPPTAAEKKLHGDALALFQRVAPNAPDGWKATDTGGTLTTLCLGSQLRRGFNRTFDLERGRAERDQEAQQAYATMMEQQRAKAAANQAAADAIDARINALALKVQAAATAQKFDQIEPLNKQIDSLMKQKIALTGVDDLQAQSDRIEAEATRDTHASFALYFEPPKSEPQDGAPAAHPNRRWCASRGIPHACVRWWTPPTSSRSRRSDKTHGTRGRSTACLPPGHARR